LCHIETIEQQFAEFIVGEIVSEFENIDEFDTEEDADCD